MDSIPRSADRTCLCSNKAKPGRQWQVPARRALEAALLWVRGSADAEGRGSNQSAASGRRRWAPCGQPGVWRCQAPIRAQERPVGPSSQTSLAAPCTRSDGCTHAWRDQPPAHCHLPPPLTCVGMNPCRCRHVPARLQAACGVAITPPARATLPQPTGWQGWVARRVAGGDARE